MSFLVDDDAMQHFDNEIAILEKGTRMMPVAHLCACIKPAASFQLVTHDSIVAVVGRYSAHYVYIVTDEALFFVANKHSLRKIGEKHVKT